MSLAMFGMLGMDFKTASMYSMLMGGGGGNMLLPLLLMGQLGGTAAPDTGGAVYANNAVGSTLQLGNIGSMLLMSKLLGSGRRSTRRTYVYNNRRSYYSRRRYRRY